MYNNVVKKRWLLLLPVLAIFLLLVLIFGVVKTGQAFSQLKKGQLAQATQSAHIASPIATFVSGITLHRFAFLEIWKNSTETIPLLSATVTQAKDFISQSTQLDPHSKETLNDLQISFSQLSQHLTLIDKNLEKSWLAATIIPQATRSQLHQLTTSLPDAQQVLQKLASGKHRYIFILQNSEELRATGGFMGSYGLLELNDGVLTTLNIQDIYEPDGQFTGFVEAPPGVNEYLSSGKGFRLPDSNWSPDFPTAAEEMLRFFNLGKQTDIEGIVAINLPVAEKMLDIIGPVYLPDYQTTVTSENLSALARADRDQFFPGSQQKRNFLQALFTQLKLQFTNLAPEKQLQLAQLLHQQLVQKNIQLYSRQTELENLARKYRVAGQMSTGITELSSLENLIYLFPVESNVGINKANKRVTREATINLSDTHATLTIKWKNQNPQAEKPQNYINYQRVFVLPEARVHSLEINGQPQEKWDENLITTTSEQQFKQIGFLVPVAAQNEGTLVLDVSYPTKPQPILVIQKQSGLPPTPFTITNNNHTQTFLLEKDLQISW
jgi:hypothetical protein